MTRDDTASNGKPASGPKSVPGRESLKAALPKRFYETVAVGERDGRFAILLDGRTVRTPGKRELAFPVEPLAAAVAGEWQAQGERIDPATMPLTRLANSAIDAVAERMGEVADDVVAFAGSDLLCYRADGPATLVERQAAAWDPVLAWAKRDLGAGFKLRVGLMPIEQPAEALDAVRAALAGLPPLGLAAVHVMTTIAGSALLAIAHLRGALTLDEAWRAATVDETWQSEQWGHDAEAAAHAAERFADFKAASRCLGLLHSRR